MADGWLAASGRLIRSHAAIFAVLAIWAFAPLVVAVIHVTGHGGVMTGTYGTDFFDQFQYLAWIRDEGSHLLAANLWQIAPSPHDYVQPMYLISGALWWAGLSIQLAYLLWLPVALVVLAVGCAAYVSRMLSGRWQQAAALILVLFYHSPVYAIAVWTGHLSGAHRFDLLRTTTDADAALQLWGFAHAAIAIGAMPIFLLAAERLLSTAPGRRRSRRLITAAALAGATVSWLHPWQGLTLLLVLAGVFALAPPRRRYLVLAVPVAATVLPLDLHRDPRPRRQLLARFPERARHQHARARVGAGGRLWRAGRRGGLRRAPAARRGRVDAVAVAGGVRSRVPPRAQHLATRAGRRHAAARRPGGPRLGARARSAPRAACRGAAAAVAAIAVFTVPAAINEGHDAYGAFRNTLTGQLSLQLLRLTDNQASALAYLDRAPRAGGVLAPWFLSMSVPAFTDRQVFAGHDWWGPPPISSPTKRLQSPRRGRSGAALRRAILQHSRAAFVLADCDAAAVDSAGTSPRWRDRCVGCLTLFRTHGWRARRGAGSAPTSSPVALLPASSASTARLGRAHPRGHVNSEPTI